MQLTICAARCLGAGLLALFAAAPSFANLILLSDTRIISTSGQDSTGYNEAHTITAPPFAVFNQSTGANGAVVSMQSTLSATQLSLQAFTTAFLSSSSLPPGSSAPWAAHTAEALCEVVFQVDAPLLVHLTGYRDRGLYGLWEHTLTSSSGNVPLNFTTPPYYLNYMDQLVTLTPGIYTLTGRTLLSTYVSGSAYDGSHLRLNLDLTVVGTVPDETSAAGLLALGCVGLLAFRRRVLR